MSTRTTDSHPDECPNLEGRIFVNSSSVMGGDANEVFEVSINPVTSEAFSGIARELLESLYNHQV